MAKLIAISWPPHHLLVVEERAVRVHVGIVALLHDHRVGRDLRIRDFIVMDKTNTKDTAVQCSSCSTVGTACQLMGGNRACPTRPAFPAGREHEGPG